MGVTRLFIEHEVRLAVLLMIECVFLRAIILLPADMRKRLVIEVHVAVLLGAAL